MKNYLNDAANSSSNANPNSNNDYRLSCVKLSSSVKRVCATSSSHMKPDMIAFDMKIWVKHVIT